MKNWLKKLIQKEHTELRWSYWGKMFRNRNEVDNLIYEAYESICHECSDKDKVENDQNYKVVEKTDFIMKKDMENKEKEGKKCDLDYEDEV